MKWQTRLFVLSAIFVSLSLQLSAQEKFSKPDFKEIEKTVKDKNSLYYYPKMLGRYINNDTSLGKKEYFMLYFGYFFHDDQADLKKVSYQDSITKIIQKEDPGRDDWARLIGYCKESLKRAPFDLRTLNMTYAGYKKLEDVANCIVYRKKIQGIVNAIRSTGNGKSEETAMYVLEVGDEYSMLSILGYEFDGAQSLTAKQCDYLTVKSNKDNLKGLYFDVNQIFNGYEKLFKSGK